MVKLNRIYTRTGDDGTTGLVDGSRLAKSAARMQAIGDVDELNSALGLALLQAQGADERAALLRIQNDLFDLGADLATPGNDFTPSEMSLRIVAAQVMWLEAQIDAITTQLEPLNSFILPSGSALASYLHLARAICRRAERSAVQAAQDVAINPLALSYINRLSDYLFVAARMANDAGRNDVKWIPGASR